MAKEMTLADHAEAWRQEQGHEVPARDSEKWKRMYETWATWAFSDLRTEERPRRRRQSKRLMS